MPQLEKYPLISVIVPIYQVEEYIEKCIDSILNQTYQNLEIILVDDGSKDKCPEICDKYASQDKRIKVIHKQNGGLSSARNAGLDICTGEYICFADSDDWIFPEMIQRLYELLKKTDADIAQCKAMHNLSPNKETKVTEQIIEHDDIWKNAILEIINWVVWLRLYKRVIWENLRYEEGYYFEDILAFPGIVEQCQRYVVTTEKLYWYNRRGGGILRQEKTIKHIESKEYLFRKLEKYFQDNNMMEDVGAFYLCLNIPGYRNGIYKSTQLDEETIKRHNKKMHKMFRKYYDLARKSILYQRISIIRKIEWILYFFSPKLCFKVISVYRKLRERKAVENGT